MSRFVILHHHMPASSGRPSHWDVMLEDDAALLTWAVESAPELEATQVALRLADHRMEYLDYEGPVSGNRGSVTQWDHGEFQWLERTGERISVRLSGQRLQATATFELQSPSEDAGETQRWSVSLRKI